MLKVSPQSLSYLQNLKWEWADDIRRLTIAELTKLADWNVALVRLLKFPLATKFSAETDGFYLLIWWGQSVKSWERDNFHKNL